MTLLGREGVVALRNVQAQYGHHSFKVAAEEFDPEVGVYEDGQGKTGETLNPG